VSENSAGISVRISRAALEADLDAVVWPGVSTVYYPRAESAEEIHAVAARIDGLERLRGIRPGTIGVGPLIESPAGASVARAIAASSSRIRTFGVGPNLSMRLGAEPGSDAVIYARGECELYARALGLQPLNTEFILD
jgi:citrate lyase beta subunit